MAGGLGRERLGVEGLAAEALRPGPDPLVEATSVYRFAQSPFAVWCDRFAPEAEKDELGAFQKLLFEQGREHEARVLAGRFPGAVALAYETEEDGFHQALDAMAEGADAILGPPLFFLPDGLKGRADLLQRVDGGASVFGDYHYEVREIKLARNVQAHHVLQAAFYNRILGRIQGYTPAQVVVINRDLEAARFAYDEPALLASLRAIRAIQDGTRPDAIHGRGTWPWETYTDKCAREARDVSLVAGIGQAFREKLVSAGLRTVEHLAEATEENLRSIRGVGSKKAAQYRTNAQALVRGTHIRTGAVQFEPAATEIFLDLEGTGAQATDEGLVEMDYLIGALVRQDGRERYIPFIAHTLDDEETMFRAFLDWLAEQSDHTLYHWHHYEATHLKKLAARYGMAEDMHAHLFGRMRDLYRDATSAFAFPTYNQSIKSIAPYMGFAWRHKDVNAMESIALHFEYASTGDRATLQKILDYNEDDCIAMRVVKDWLAAQG